MSLITIEKVEDLYQGWSKCYLLHIKDGKGNRRTYQAEDHGNGVGVLPYDPERRTALLIHQVRPPAALAGFDERIYEIPAGIIEDNIEECARREAFEEAGVALKELEPIGTFWVIPGLSTERVALFLAPYSASDLKGAGGGLADEHEDIIVREVSLTELARMADAMEITDLKSYLAVQTLRQRHADLF
jgi:nudix-type nucleoside diphosphatase (YffH/AdpP family)